MLSTCRSDCMSTNTAQKKAAAKRESKGGGRGRGRGRSAAGTPGKPLSGKEAVRQSVAKSTVPLSKQIKALHLPCMSLSHVEGHMARITRVKAACRMCWTICCRCGRRLRPRQTSWSALGMTPPRAASCTAR